MLAISLLVLILTSFTLSDEAKKIKEFKFTRWFNAPGRQTARGWHKDVIDKIIAFYDKFRFDTDLSGALGLFLLKVNAGSSLNYIKHLKKTFEQCKFCKCNYTKEEKILEGFSERVDNFTDTFINHMFARVARLNPIRRVASGILFAEDNWSKNLAPFALVPHTLRYSLRLANSWTVPTAEEYKNAIINTSVTYPTTGETNECLVQLADTVGFLYGIPQKCNVETQCLDYILEGDNFGYSLSHRIFMLIYAKFAKNCYFTTVLGDKNLVTKLCSAARLESDYLSSFLDYDVPGLLMEFIAYCSLDSHRESMNQDWFEQFVPLYSTSGTELCYARHEHKGKNPYTGDHESTPWKIVKGEKEPMGPCDRHLTGAALAAHAAAYRATIQPIYCCADDSLCYVPSLQEDLIKVFTNGRSGPKSLDSWYQLLYMTGYVKEYDKVNFETENYFVSLDMETKRKWIDRPVLDKLRKEPNAGSAVTYSPRDGALGILH